MNEVPLNGSEIGKQLGISRQAVSYSIRKSMKSMYYYILEKGMANTPFDAVLVLMSMLGVNDGDINDVKGFIKLFSKDIREDIQNDAITIYGIKEICVPTQ